MDREIPKEVRQKERNKKIIRYSAIGVAGVIVVSVLISLMRVGVEEKDLVFSTVDKGVIEVSVSASGNLTSFVSTARPNFPIWRCRSRFQP